MDELFQVPATVTKLMTMAQGSMRIIADTQEGLTDEMKGKLASLHEKFGWLTFSVEKRIAPEAIANLDPIEEDNGKSPAQRLRNCLFVLWEQRGKVGTFEEFYRSTMEKFTDNIKEKLA